MKHAFLLLCLSMSLYANLDEYTMQKQENSTDKYFIKLAAYLDEDNAKKLQSTVNIPTKIVHMKDYYSLVSDEFNNINEAKQILFNIKKNFEDAYIITLYKKRKKIEPIIVKKVPKKEIVKKIIREKSPYEKGIEFYRAKEYEDALMFFDRALIDDENDIDARRYYAKTLYKLSLFKEAKKEFLLLHEISPDKEIEGYLKNIEKKHKRNFFSTNVSLGAGFDDNINLTTDANTTQYGSLTLINDTKKIDSIYGLATLSLNHRYVGKFFNLYSALYSYNELAHTAKGNDLNFLDANTMIYKKYGNFSISLPLGFNTSYLDGDNIGYNIYTNPNITYNISKTLKTFANISFLDNTSKFAKSRDYTVFGGGFGVRYDKKRFQNVFMTNLQSYSAKKDLRYDISKDVMAVMMQSRYYLFASAYLGANLSFKKDKYRDLDEVMGYKREDEAFSYGAFVGKNITKNILFHFRYKHTKNSSNINVYSYEKNTFALECKYKF